MESIPKIRHEHKEIDIELKELEAVIEDEEINMANLKQSFNKIHNLWNNHEEKEEKLFEYFREKGIDFPIDELLFKHRELKGHKKVVQDAIASGSEEKIRVALDTDGRMLISKLRKHAQEEEELFDKLRVK